MTEDDRLGRKRERNREYMKQKRAQEREQREAKGRNQYTAYWPIDELVIEIRLLKGTDSPRNIARRLGYAQPASLYKRLINHGYTDLAPMFSLHGNRSAA